MIENFAELSFEEQKKFAEALVKTLNSEHTFIDYADFKVSKVEADDLTGDLIIELEHDDPIYVSRKADWADLSNVYDLDIKDLDDVDFVSSIFEDAEKAFKVLSADVEGYTVSLSVDDVDQDEVFDVAVTYSSKEDSGIGNYDYFGFRGYDSRPYVEAEGIIEIACTCALSLYVEPTNTSIADPEIVD